MHKLTSTNPKMFMILGRDDNPLFTLNFKASKGKEVNDYQSQFAIHASLDEIDELIWKKQNIFLGIIDPTPDNLVSAMVSYGHTKFLLLHETKNDEATKQFFNDTYELYLKRILNPFYKINTPIKCSNFDVRVKQLAKKHLNANI
eukprot:TRINITY_DN15357_c0_g1_i1.p1 TRINITY_DN15357_c0_g1~~TRINITY_DN15357_c0_g1_i1.p1  ORF type:complete len:145 (-),score=35.29 TRINITY_DN15357_c0_g1_i1:33-467(-)